MGFRPWQLVTYAFLHSDIVQLLFNLLALWMFGIELEQLWGERRFMQFVLASGLAGAVVYLVLSFIVPGMVFFGMASVVFGLLLAFGMLFPHRPILVFMVWPTTMRNATIIFGVIVLVFAVLGYLGVQPPSPVGERVSQVGTLFYFGFFLLMPWWSQIGTFKRAPDRVTFSAH